MKNKVKTAANDSELFWNMSKDFINHQLPIIQNASPNTVKSYREGNNQFIDFLEENRGIQRDKISFKDYSRDNIKLFMEWMRTEKKYADTTCNLRLTAIHSLLEYAADERSIDLMSIYVESKTVDGIDLTEAPIEFFEEFQMKALLDAPNTSHRTGRRNQMMLVLYYDTGARISELINANVSQLHLNSDIPFIELQGKGRTYRNVPIMESTVKHLHSYLDEFHPGKEANIPLFYSISHGELHGLSPDTVEKMIKKYSSQCESTGTTMPKKPHCHMIRKTRAMDLYKNGMSLPHIQQLLGHKSISTTRGFYAFATLESLAEAMKKANKKTEAENSKKWKDEAVKKAIYRL